jgi:hypothetical protein
MPEIQAMSDLEVSWPKGSLRAQMDEEGDSRLVGDRLIEAIEKEQPLLMAAMYPRKYNSLGPYYSPKLLAAALTKIAIDSAIVVKTEKSYDKLPIAYKICLPAIQPSMKMKMSNMLFLSQKLLEAVKHTDFREDINWTTMDLPYDCGILMLPKGGLVHPVDGDCAFIIWSRTKKDGEYLPPIKGMHSLLFPVGMFGFATFCPKTGIWYDSNLTETLRPTLKLNNLFYLEEGESVPHIEIRCSLDTPLTLEDDAFLNEIGSVLFGTFLVLDARPTLLTPGKMERLVPGKKDRPPCEFWTPNVIGRDYAPRTIKLAPTGTHNSPRFHWVRGHHRPLLSEKIGRRIWVEPYPRGLE